MHDTYEHLFAERYAKIEHENRVLLQKMSEIMQSDGLDNVNEEQKYATSLNRNRRKRELQRITQENQVCCVQTMRIIAYKSENAMPRSVISQFAENTASNSTNDAYV